MARWTATDLATVLARLGGPDPGPPPPASPKPKYGNTPTQYAGRRYDSKLEAQFAAEIDLEWQAGSVLWSTTQVPFRLPGGVLYRADFLVVRPQQVQVIDCTGVMTQVKRNKLKQVQELYGLTVLIYRRDRSLQPFDIVPVGR